ncbi:MAG: hypothetical protein A2Y70_01830 [Candidatus Aminicenantes bacterium RBG_13_64_14]|nr:MAG: hypothetical protein A2Y70_01830 [Candidatus Aminicenantes bacterium RBG_13_64_14]
MFFKKMKRILTAWTAALLLTATCLGEETTRQRELSLSLGSGIGDFHSAFTWGLCLNLPVKGNLRLEPELFYYFDPLKRSQIPGLAITSTALSAGMNYLFRFEFAGGRILLDAGVAWGVMHVSETHEVDSLKQFTSRKSTGPYIGPAAVIQFRLDRFSGIRFDFRALAILRDGDSIPRLSIGYAFWY